MGVKTLSLMLDIERKPRKDKGMRFWNQENTMWMTARDIAGLLPPSWAFSFVDIAAAMNYYHPNGLEA